jgi:hypothetical protein
MVSLQPMTLHELLSLIVSIAGFVVVIITLALLIRQTREMTTQSEYVAKSVKYSLYATASSHMLAVDEMFINHPALRPYFYSGKDISEDDPVYDKAIAVADFILDFFDYVLIQGQYFPQVFRRQSWEPYMTDTFANSPVLCRQLDHVKDRDWHSDDLVAIMRAGKAQQQTSDRSDPQD